MMDMVMWTPERREILNRALRKAQAGAEQREIIAMSGAEAQAMRQAAESWNAMMEFLDARAAAGDLDGLVAERECPSSPDGRHQVDTSMESGPNNCFHCEAPMGAAAPGLTQWIVADPDRPLWRVWRNGRFEWTSTRGCATRYPHRAAAEEMGATTREPFVIEEYRSPTKTKGKTA